MYYFVNQEEGTSQPLTREMLMEKGQQLKSQAFQRYFMGDVETVNAEIIDTVGEYALIVKIGDEFHKVTFSLDGTMRSRERLAATTEQKTTKGDANMENETLYINNEKLGSECYIGTRDQFRKELTPTCFKQWYYEYENNQQDLARENGDDNPEIMSFEEWVQDCLDKGLSVATDDDIASYPRLTA